jgi:uncharacterized membrane protein
VLRANRAPPSPPIPAHSALTVPGLILTSPLQRKAAFIRAFQTSDRIIQNNQPLFMFVWAGSVLAVIGTAVTAIWVLTGVDRLLIIVAALLYLLGVQVPTIAINIPLNNQLQRLDVATMTGTARQRARETFEARWNRWNVIRTLCASVVAGLLMFLLRRA